MQVSCRRRREPRADGLVGALSQDVPRRCLFPAGGALWLASSFGPRQQPKAPETSFWFRRGWRCAAIGCVGRWFVVLRSANVEARAT